jgi:small subunit ribosomal protein S27Ae
MAKARVGLYELQGETLVRSHKSCPKCGPGTFLAEHSNRRSCGRCGYSESKEPSKGPSKEAKPRPGGKSGKAKA